jgi:hypothetical protein
MAAGQISRGDSTTGLIGFQPAEMMGHRLPQMSTDQNEKLPKTKTLTNSYISDLCSVCEICGSML